MKQSKNSDEIFQRMYFKSYLKMINNSVGSSMFKNFYLRDSEGKEFDALDSGRNSCAFFVSSVLVIFNKINSIHGTVIGTQADLEKSGWVLTDQDKMQKGDVIIWESQTFDDGTYRHIGFFTGGETAVSTSVKSLRVVDHDLSFNGHRKITHLYHMANW